MHAPVRELLKRQDPKALDVPTTPRPGLNAVGQETADYQLASDFFKTPIQGMLHPPVDPDGDVMPGYDQYPSGQ